MGQPQSKDAHMEPFFGELHGQDKEEEGAPSAQAVTTVVGLPRLPPRRREPRLEDLGELEPLIPGSQGGWLVQFPGSAHRLPGLQPQAMQRICADFQAYFARRHVLVDRRQKQLERLLISVQQQMQASRVLVRLELKVSNTLNTLERQVKQMHELAMDSFNELGRMVDMTARLRLNLSPEDRRELDASAALFGFDGTMLSPKSRWRAARLVREVSASVPWREELQTKAWLDEVLPRWEQVPKRRLAELASKGIPQQLRSVVWRKAVGNALDLSKDLFTVCVEKAQYLKEHLKQLESETQRVQKDFYTNIQLIDHDIPRTFHHLGVFAEQSSWGQSLRRVLEAFACYNSRMGYVQGMSYVAAMLIAGASMEDYDAFVCMNNLLDTHFFRSLYDMDLQEIAKHLKVYELLLNHHLPALYAHFRALGVNSDHYVLDWFLNAFSRKLPLHMSSRVWDSFVFGGEVFLYKMAIGVLSTLQPALLVTTDFEGVLKHLQNLHKSLCVDDLVAVQALFDRVHELDVPEIYVALLSRLASDGQVELGTPTKQRKEPGFLAAQQEASAPSLTDQQEQQEPQEQEPQEQQEQHQPYITM